MQQSTLTNVFADYFKFKRDNMYKYNELKKIKKIELHTHFSQIVPYMNILKFYIESEYKNIIFFKVLHGKDSIQGIEFIFDERNIISQIGKKDGKAVYAWDASDSDEPIDEYGYDPEYRRDRNKKDMKLDNYRVTSVVYHKLKDDIELFPAILQRYLSHFNEQFKYYRVHSYIFKNLVYGNSDKFSDKINKFIRISYIKNVRDQMKDHNIFYLDARISHDRLDILQEFQEVFAEKSFAIKFIIQFERYKMSQFDINSLLNNPYFQQNTKFIIGIDFTGHEECLAVFSVLYKCLPELLSHNLRPFLHNGEETKDYSFQNAKETILLLESYMKQTNKQFKIPYRIGHGYQLINNQLKVPDNIYIEFCPSTLVFTDHFRNISVLGLQKNAQNIIICSDDTQRYDMDLTDCYLYLYFIGMDQNLIDIFIKNNDVLRRQLSSK